MSAPTLGLPATPAITYSVDRPAPPYVAGDTVTITAMLASGHVWGSLPGGWSTVTPTTATLMVTFDAAECISILTATPAVRAEHRRRDLRDDIGPLPPGPRSRRDGDDHRSGRRMGRRPAVGLDPLVGDDRYGVGEHPARRVCLGRDDAAAGDIDHGSQCSHLVAGDDRPGDDTGGTLPSTGSSATGASMLLGGAALAGGLALLGVARRRVAQR